MLHQVTNSSSQSNLEIQGVAGSSWPPSARRLPPASACKACDSPHASPTERIGLQLYYDQYGAARKWASPPQANGKRQQNEVPAEVQQQQKKPDTPRSSTIAAPDFFNCLCSPPPRPTRPVSSHCCWRSRLARCGPPCGVVSPRMRPRLGVVGKGKCAWPPRRGT